MIPLLSLYYRSRPKKRNLKFCRRRHQEYSGVQFVAQALVVSGTELLSLRKGEEVLKIKTGLLSSINKVQKQKIPGESK